MTRLHPVLDVAYESCETKIANFQLVGLRVDEQVFRLDVAVHDLARVEILNCFQYLVNKHFNAFSAETIWFFLEDFQEVSVHEFKDQVQFSFSKIQDYMYELKLTF